MSLEKLLHKIRSDAEEESRRILAAAEEEAVRIRKEAEEEARREAESIARSFGSRAERERLNILSRARLEGRISLLATKDEFVEEVVRETARLFRELPEESYRGWLKGIILEGVVSGNEMIMASRHDRDLLESGLLEEINRELAAMGKRGELTLSGEEVTFDRGVILRGEGLEVNLSVDALLQRVWEENEEIIIRLLFGPGEGK